jgi:uncharacterized protein (TIGR02186 family)
MRLVRAALTLLPLVAAAGGARADTLSADLSSHLVAIDSNFTGTSLLMFGAVEVDGPGKRDVVVVLRGPERPVTVRRKDRVAGIWVNAASVEYPAVPGYFSVASSRPLEQVASPTTLGRYQLDIPYLRIEPAPGTEPDPDRDLRFREALIRLKTKEGLYGTAAARVTFSGPNLFRAEFPVPSNVPLGNYKAEAYLFRDGALVAAQSSPLFVDKSGIERRLFTLSRRRPAIYASAAIVLAVAAGWFAAYVFRRS